MKNVLKNKFKFLDSLPPNFIFDFVVITKNALIIYVTNKLQSDVQRYGTLLANLKPLSVERVLNQTNTWKLTFNRDIGMN